MVVTARHEKTLSNVEHLGVATSLDNAGAIAGADTVVLAVHPDQALNLCRTHRASFRPGALLISIVTGVSIDELRDAVGAGVNVVRAMPNIAAVVGASTTSVSLGQGVPDDQVLWVRAIFDSVGTTVTVDERLMDACTGLGGCGPAFAFKVIESLATGGVKMGLPRDVARTMAASVLLGAARLVLTSGKHPAELKDDVTTPGGCTIDGITELEARGLPIAMIAAVEASTRKAATIKNRSQCTPKGPCVS